MSGLRWSEHVARQDAALQSIRRDRAAGPAECVCGAVGGSRHVHLWRDLGLSGPYAFAGVDTPDALPALTYELVVAELRVLGGWRTAQEVTDYLGREVSGPVADVLNRAWQHCLVARRGHGGKGTRRSQYEYMALPEPTRLPARKGSK